MDDINPGTTPAHHPQHLPARELSVISAGFPYCDLLLSYGDTPAFLVDVSTWAWNRPHILLREGAKDGAVVGASYYRRSRTIRCGVGADEMSMQWTELRHPGNFKSLTFAFEWEGWGYTMQRAKSADLGASGLQTMLGSHFKVVDDMTGAIVALYISEVGVGRRMANLRFSEGVSDKFEIVVVLAIMSFRDKLQRTRSAGVAAGVTAA